MAQVMNNIPEDLYTEHSGQHRKALVIAHIALEMYISDVVSNTERKIKEAALPLQKSSDATEAAKAKRSLKFLSQWKKTSYPLSFDERAYQKLLQALEVILGDIQGGLPNRSEEPVSMKDFASAILNVSKPKSTSPTQAPFFKGGISSTVMKTAVPLILDLSRATDENAKTAFAITALTVAVKKLKILFIPWKPAQLQPNRGRHSVQAVFNSWVSFEGGPAANVKEILLVE
jgi:hypothetical protein